MSFGNDTPARILECRVVLHLIKALDVFEQDFKDIQIVRCRNAKLGQRSEHLKGPTGRTSFRKDFPSRVVSSWAPPFRSSWIIEKVDVAIRAFAVELSARAVMTALMLE